MSTALNDEQDVRDLFDRYIKSRNSGDLDGFEACFGQGATCFYRNGAPLREIQSKAERSLRYQNGYKASITTRDVQIQTFDGAFAILTATTDGTVVNPDGTKETGPWRLSAFLRKLSNGWAILHVACGRLMINATIPS